MRHYGMFVLALTLGVTSYSGAIEEVQEVEDIDTYLPRLDGESRANNDIRRIGAESFAPSGDVEVHFDEGLLLQPARSPDFYTIENIDILEVPQEMIFGRTRSLWKELILEELLLRL